MTRLAFLVLTAVALKASDCTDSGLKVVHKQILAEGRQPVSPGSQSSELTIGTIKCSQDRKQALVVVSSRVSGSKKTSGYQLWSVATLSGKATLLLDTSLLKGLSHENTIDEVAFAGSSRAAYAVVGWSSTAGVLLECGFDAGSCREVDIVIGFRIISEGPNRGRLMVVKRNAGGETVTTDYYLVAPDYSSCIAYLGESQNEADALLDRRIPMEGGGAPHCNGWTTFRPGVLR